MMRHPFLELSRSNAPFEEELKLAAAEVIGSGWYINGRKVGALEEELAALTRTSHCVAVSNGLDALRLIFRAYLELGRLEPGTEVIVPANTYIASILPVTEFGLTPVFADPRPDDFCLDWPKVEPLLTDRTGAVVVTHLFGNPSWDPELAARLRERGILILEDNAQAIGASIHGRPTGGLGDAAIFSFYPTKNIGALGDAGAVTTSDPELAKTVRALANYGSDTRYHNIYAGYNCRMDEIQAAMLLVKLRHLPEIVDARQKAAEAYDRAIDCPAVVKPKVFRDGRTQVWHQYTLLTDRRDAIRDHLLRNGVDTDVNYPVPPHLQPCYRGRYRTHLPVTEDISSRLFQLPIANISPEDAREIAEILNSFRAQQ